MHTFKIIDYKDDEATTNQILFDLKNVGFIILKKFPLSKHKEEDFLQLNQKIGVPVSHDTNQNYVWNIKQNENSISNITTFSEHNQEASLHTDSQYSEYPEDFFSLLCIKKANCGGGLSSILKLSDILSELEQTKEGNKCIKILSTNKFPFIVPSVFSKKDKLKYEFNFGYVLSKNEIRYREDILEKALELNPSYKTTENLFALNLLKRTINQSNKTLSFYLEEGDIIFINNKSTLHGRSSFVDTDRHLLRVRLNQK
jgi:alpha-ketoglutarate-dependent taurine dioxygenase